MSAKDLNTQENAKFKMVKTKRRNWLKEMVFCQGDKRELEEITGREYEYIPLSEMERSIYFMEHIREPYMDGFRNLENKHRTFIIGFGENHGEAVKDLHDKVEELKADAIIHYSGPIKARWAGRKGYEIIGTPLRKRKNK